MAHRGGERRSTRLGVGPSHDGCAFASLCFLCGGGDWIDIEYLAIVVELFVFGGPVFETLGDGVAFVGVSDFQRLLRSVSGGVEPEVFSPFVGAIAEGVHRAMQVDGRDGLVDFENAVDDLQVLVVGGALVVNDDVVTFGPIVRVVDWKWRIGRAITGPHDIDLDIGT